MTPTLTRWLSDQVAVANENPAPDRFVIQAWFDGYDILDHGVRICRFHGPDSDFPNRHLARLRADAETNAARDGLGETAHG